MKKLERNKKSILTLILFVMLFIINVSYVNSVSCSISAYKTVHTICGSSDGTCKDCNYHSTQCGSYMNGCYDRGSWDTKKIPIGGCSLTWSCGDYWTNSYTCSGSAGYRTYCAGTCGGSYGSCGSSCYWVRYPSYDSNCCSPSNGGVEMCDGIDNDCDGAVDEGCDSDGDGYLDANLDCAVGYTCDDCNDDNAAISPGALELCNLIDDNCDGSVDEVCDNDQDTYADADTWCVGSFLDWSGTIQSCSTNDNDCNDMNLSINPSSFEYCDGIVDDNCDGTVDEGCSCIAGETELCVNQEGVCAGTIKTCDLTGAMGSCEFTDDHELTELTCDYLDNDCDGLVDEGVDGINNSLWEYFYYDADGDGYGETANNVTGCYLLENYSRYKGDCNDNSPNIHPFAEEICGDNIDNDCNGLIDDNDCGLTQSSTLIIEECGESSYDDVSLRDLVTFDSLTCPVTSPLNIDSCSGYPVLNLLSMEYGLRFHSPDYISSSCQVIITEEGTEGISAVSLNNRSLVLVNKERSILGTDCGLTTSYYQGLVDLISGDELQTETVNVSAGKNLVNIEAQSAKVRNIEVVCGENPLLNQSTEFSVDLYEVQSPITMDVNLGASPTNYPLSYFGNLSVVFNFDDPLLIIDNMPNFCSASAEGTFFYVECFPTSYQFNLDIRFSSAGTHNLTTTLKYNNFPGVISMESDYSLSILAPITAEEFSVNKSASFILSNGDTKEFKELLYGDTVRRIAVTCDRSSSSAEVIIRNKNREFSCPYFSNDLRGDGVIYFDLETEDIVKPESKFCAYPFTINRSGLYELEVSCIGNSTNPEGDVCYNPLPAILPITFTGWSLYWDLGRYIFSFFGENSIPDYVCNSEAKLKPITLFNQALTIDVKDQQDKADIDLLIIDPVSSVDIQQNDYYDFKVNVTCNNPAGCQNVEVYLDP